MLRNQLKVKQKAMQKTSNYNEILSSSKEYVNILLEELPLTLVPIQKFRGSDNASATNPDEDINAIAVNIEKTIDSFKKIPLEIKQINGKPVQAIAFCGPAKSGKSTVFKLMSGFNTSTGYDISTMSSLAIIPNNKNEIYPTEKLISDSENIFPNFEPKPFETPSDVIKKGEPDNRLFVGSYNPENENNPINVVLIDLPDFDSIYDTNWEKAKLGISRADTVIFTVSNEKYRSESVFNIMKEVLSKAGSFVYLLTKLDPEDGDFKSCAERIRNNLLEDVSNNEEFANTKNADGKSLVELLNSCPFYYSPRKSRPAADEIKKLINCSAEFKKMLFTGAVETIFESKFKKLRYSSEQALQQCEDLQYIVEKQQKFLKEIEEISNQTAEKIIGSDESWPLPYVLTILREELNKSRSSLILEIEKIFSKIILFIPSMLKKAKKSLSELISNSPIGISKEGIKARIEQEADNCLKEICLNKNAPTKLKYESIERSEFVKEFMTSEPPYFGDWQDEVRADINNWIKEQEAEQLKRASEEANQNEEDIPYGLIENESGFAFRLKQISFYALLPFKKIYDLVSNIANWLSSRTRYEWLKIINQVGGDILLPLGVLLIILDYFIDGGMGQFGLITLIGACPALSGALTSYLMQIIGAIGLENIAEKAQKSWKERSINSCKEFFIEKLIKPNILNHCISKENIEECLLRISNSKEACKKLQNCLNNNGN